jgi:hypothetical protein
MLIKPDCDEFADVDLGELTGQLEYLSRFFYQLASVNCGRYGTAALVCAAVLSQFLDLLAET